MKEDIEANLYRLPYQDHYREAIVRDVQRCDVYPEIEDEGTLLSRLFRKRGPSAWFKAGFLDPYHRGVKLSLGIEGLIWVPEHNVWRMMQYDVDKDLPFKKVMMVGYVPYDRIVQIDWTGDEYYRDPHIYCEFRGRMGPYEALKFHEIRESGESDTYSLRVGGALTTVKAARAIARRMGFKPD